MVLTALVAAVTVSALLSQLAIAVPAIILASNTLTAALQGIFDIKNTKVVHVMNWVIGVLAGLGFVAFNGLTFGLAPWANYVLGGVAGLLAAAASNGVYDWEVMKKFFDGISDLFPSPVRKARAAEYRAKLAE